MIWAEKLNEDLFTIKSCLSGLIKVIAGSRQGIYDNEIVFLSAKHSFFARIRIEFSPSSNVKLAVKMFVALSKRKFVSKIWCFIESRIFSGRISD